VSAFGGSAVTEEDSDAMRNELVNIRRSDGRGGRAASPVRLSFDAARASPCADCESSPCCTHLPLQSFAMQTLADLDNAIFLLSFDHIELSLTIAGEWSVYYARPCTFLDAGTFGCTLHGSPRQPDICVHYSPYQCFYRPTFRAGAPSGVLRVDRARIERFASLVAFDDDRVLRDLPSWETLVRELGEVPLTPAVDQPPRGPEEDPTRAWRQLVTLRTRGGGAAPEAFNPADPCAGCEAHCCKTLVFPHPLPVAAAQLDFFSFCLGFPGVQLGVADGAWAILVQTTCRHLEGNRCAVHGLPERPLRCRYYSAQSCSYKPIFAHERPEGFVRIGRAELPALMEAVAFDACGNVAGLPAPAELRDRIEARWLEPR